MSFWFKILIAIVIVEALGGIGAAITSDQIAGWYAYLKKPAGTPPNWVFGPVWITLYAMMGAAFGLIWNLKEPGLEKGAAFTWFGIQLVLNIAWTPVFFGLHQMLSALVVIIALWAAIATTILCFWRLAPLAAILLVPCQAWVSYATYLNAGYWWLNR